MFACQNLAGGPQTIGSPATFCHLMRMVLVEGVLEAAPPRPMAFQCHVLEQLVPVLVTHCAVHLHQQGGAAPPLAVLQPEPWQQAVLEAHVTALTDCSSRASQQLHCRLCACTAVDLCEAVPVLATSCNTGT